MKRIIDVDSYRKYFFETEDIDFTIMMHMNIEELRFFCQTNKYANLLCHNKNFWLEKILYDGLVLPENIMIIENTNWFKIYDTLNLITEYTDINPHEIISYNINLSKKNLFFKLLDQYDIAYSDNVENNVNLNAIIYWYSPKNDVYEIAYEININYELIIDITEISHEQLINFLTNAMLNNIIFNPSIK
jgi:hypothetical protein